MTPNQARIILGINSTESHDEEDLKDAYDEQIFENARFFLNRAFLPKLAKARIKKVEQIEQAYETLGGIPQNSIQDVFHYDFDGEADISELVSSMLKVESLVKLKLSQAQSGQGIIHALTQWVEIIESYAKAYFRLFQPSSENNQDAGVSVSKGLDYAELLNALKKGDRDIAEQEFWRLKKIL